MLAQTCSGIDSMGKDKGEGKGGVVKGDAKGKGGMATGYGAGDICDARIRLYAPRDSALALWVDDHFYARTNLLECLQINKSNNRSSTISISCLLEEIGHLCKLNTNSLSRSQLFPSARLLLSMICRPRGVVALKMRVASMGKKTPEATA